MRKRTTIQVGDWVRVWFVNRPGISRARVDRKPQNTGDSWILVDLDDDVHYVQMFEEIRLLERGPYL